MHTVCYLHMYIYSLCYLCTYIYYYIICNYASAYIVFQLWILYDIYIYIIHVFYVSVTYFCITVFIYSWCQENGPFSVHSFYPYFLVHRLHWEPFSGNTRYAPLDCPLTVYTYYLLWLSIVDVVYCCLYLLYVIYSVYIYIYIYVYIVCSVCMYVMLYVNVCNDIYLCSVYVICLLHISVPNII